MKPAGAGDDDEDVLDAFATPAEELEFWRTHTIDGRRCKPLKPVTIERSEPDLHMTPWTPPPDLFADLSYEEWKEGMERLPALYWDPYESLGLLMGRPWSPFRWG